ncbi:adenylate/guanylate cyclase domain-containing protein, partial [Thioclava sp. BHET1]
MKTGTDVSETLIERVEQWLEQAALDGAEIETIVAGTCERLAAAGVPLTRVHLSFSMLHPLYDAIGFTWLRGGGLTIEGFRGRQGDSNPERFLSSPYYYLLQH